MPRGHPPGRRSGPCTHCDMVDDYRAERGRQLDELEGPRRQDEQAGATMIVFKRWLQVFEWPAREADRWAS